MKLLYLAFAFFLSTAAHSEALTLPIPGEKWTVTLDGPHITKLKDAIDAGGYSYAGNADRLNISLFVGKPMCPGGDSGENMYKCFGEQLQNVPGVIPQTIGAAYAPRGVEISYMIQMNVNGKVVRSINAHLLFAHQGKWGDLHVSIVQPTRDDTPMMAALLGSIAIVDHAQ